MTIYDRIAGIYDPSHEIVLSGRSYQGMAGNHILTPLVLEDGHKATAIRQSGEWVYGREVKQLSPQLHRERPALDQGQVAPVDDGFGISYHHAQALGPAAVAPRHPAQDLFDGGTGRRDQTRGLGPLLAQPTERPEQDREVPGQLIRSGTRHERQARASGRSPLVPVPARSYVHTCVIAATWSMKPKNSHAKGRK